MTTHRISWDQTGHTISIDGQTPVLMFHDHDKDEVESELVVLALGGDIQQLCPCIRTYYGWCQDGVEVWTKWGHMAIVRLPFVGQESALAMPLSPCPHQIHK